ncbi:uncharacterized protein V6R79_023815 [Siganus canaliculatus]
MAEAEDFTVTSPYYDSTSYSPYDYDYAEDYTDEICNRSSVNHFGNIFVPTFFSIVVLFSLFGNILVIVILAKYENLKSLTNSFILNLAVSDLLFTTGLPFWIYYHINGWTLGEHTCKIITFVFNIGFYSSGILLILMTAHRYVAVMNPLSDIVSSKGFISVVASAVIWTVSVAIAFPSFLFTEVQEQYYCDFKDSYWSLWGIYQQNILFLLSSVVFIFCYSQVMCRLLRPTAQKRRNKTVKLIFILMVVFFLGWAPYNIVIFLRSLQFRPPPHGTAEELERTCEKTKLLDYAFYITRLFAFSHCCLNPVFYVFVGVKFKGHLKKVLKIMGHDKGSIRNRQSRLTITSMTSGEEFSM